MSGQCPGCGAVGECYCDAQKLDVEKLIKERDEALKSREEWQQKYTDQCALYHEALHKLDDERIDSAVETLYATKATERAEKAEAEVKKLREQLRGGCTCGSGAHPRPCKRHPEAYEAHVEALNTETALEEARATLAELKEHGIDIDNGVWTGRVRLPDGSSPMTDEIEEAFVERDALRAECDDLHRALDVLRDECARLRVIEQAALYVLNAQDEGDLLDAERRVVEAFRSDATKPMKEEP